MYGYIRPVKAELKVREFELFRSVYCGLCEALRESYGHGARFLVNYDLTFLALVLMDGGDIEYRRCPVHPVSKRACLCRSRALEDAADYSVILGRWKLLDSEKDEGRAKALVSAGERRLLESAYRRAAERKPAFDRLTARCLEELDALEKDRCASLDRTADCFARILTGAAASDDPEKERIRRELFYHVGRSVYILDAVDDLAEDVKNGRYNPLRYRFTLENGALTQEQREELRSTLNLSQRSASAALSLRDEDIWQPILENIISLGLPNATELVFAGKWVKREKMSSFSSSKDKE